MVVRKYGSALNCRSAYNGETRYVTRDNLLALHVDSELLIVLLQLDAFELLIVSGHAPHSSNSTDTIVAWWTRLGSLLQQMSRKRPILMCLDANARVGSADP